MKFQKILGALMLLTGIILLSSSQTGMTGAVIGERAGGVGSILGLVLIVGGVLVMGGKSVEDTLKAIDIDSDNFRGGIRPMWTGKKNLRPGSDGNNSKKNEEAERIFRIYFREEYGYSPNKKELKSYMRPYHERGLIGEMLDYFYSRK